jgi:aspartyl-tRNA(Asn)/glutamyl-tRNA(Gln) amidotransferase subunit A
VLITPTLPTEAPRVGQETISYPDGDEDALTSLIRFTCPFNQTGLPAITVPAEGGDNNLPIGVQFIGAPFEEERVLHVAANYEALRGVRDHRPPIVRDL